MHADSKYFVSSYVTPPGPLGLALRRHDHCVALWRVSGDLIELVRYWEYERLSGFKHHGLPLLRPSDAEGVVAELLAEEGLRLADIDGFFGTPGLGDSSDEWVKEHLEHDVPIHSLAHLYSAFALDLDVMRSHTIVGLAMDGAPDMAYNNASATYAGCVCRGGDVTFFDIWSPGGLWWAAAEHFGLEPGTLMALATATDAQLRGEVERPDLETLAGRSSARDYLRRLDDMARSQIDATARDERFSVDELVASAVMKEVQALSTSWVSSRVSQILDEFDLNAEECFLALAGGFALNCPTNTHLMDEHRFKGLLVPPCVDDGGQALGLGLLGLDATFGLSNMRFQLAHPFHGRDCTSDLIPLPLRSFVVGYEENPPTATIVRDLINGPIGWVEGGAELGPRALGHRSLLGDPRTLATKEALNHIKQRQWWRPVAPMVLEECAAEWFEQSRPSPYMLEAFRVRDGQASKIPAVLHLDGTARVQTVGPGTDLDRLRVVLSAFAAETRVPLLANTSLNDRGEPIADTVADAMAFCLKKGVRVLYVNGNRVELGQPDDRQAPQLDRRMTGRFSEARRHFEAVRTAWFEGGLRTSDAVVYCYFPDIRQQLDLSTSAGRQDLRSFADLTLDQQDADERDRMIAWFDDLTWSDRVRSGDRTGTPWT